MIKWARQMCLLFAAFAIQALVAPSAHAVGLSSTYPGCANRSVTVPWGGTVNVNLTTCHFFGLGVVSTAPTHGTATPGDPAPIDTYNYQHNGVSGTTDTFVVLDDNSDFITVTVTIQPPSSPITVLPNTLPAMSAGTAFSQSLTSSGGLAPYSYTLQSGALPLGLTLSSGGVISGIPTQRGNYGFTVRATDSTTPTAQFVDKGYSGTVAPAPLSITPTSATAIQDVPFSRALTAVGGVAPHAFQLESGAFPAGISISSSGVISGTTSAAAGNYPVVLRVTDSSSGVGSHFELENFTVTVSPPPSVSIAVSPASVSEDGATNLTYTVTRSLNLSSPTVVNVSLSGTATAGTDFTGAVTTVTIPAGATTATFTIDPTVDAAVEPDETVTYQVAAGTGYTVGSPSIATGTIINDDVPAASIAVAPSSTPENGAGNLVYTVTLNAPANSPTFVNYTVAGTATSGTDFAAVTSPLLFQSGETSKTIVVDPTGDTAVEPDETVIITLTSGTGYTVGSPNAATGTIANDDFTADLAITKTNATGTVLAGTSTTYTIVASNTGSNLPGPTTATLTDTLPAVISGATWTCSGSGGGTCAASGSGNISQSVSLPVGGSVTFTVTAPVVVTATGTMSNTAQIAVTSANTIDPVSGNNQATDSDTILPAIQARNDNNGLPVVGAGGGTAYANVLADNGNGADTLSGAPATLAGVSLTQLSTSSPAVTLNTGTGAVSVAPGTPLGVETLSYRICSIANPSVCSTADVTVIVDAAMIVGHDDTNAAPVNGTAGGTAYANVLANNGNGADTLDGAAATFATVTLNQLATTDPKVSLNTATGAIQVAANTAAGTFIVTYELCEILNPANCGAASAHVPVSAPPIVAQNDTNAPGISTVTGGTAYANVLANNGNGADTLNGAAATFANVTISSASTSNPGVTLNPATGAVTVAAGTPTGPQSASYTICQQLNPTNCASAVASFTVNDPPPVAAPSSLTVAYNAGATNVPLTLSGGAATGVTIAGAPANGTAIVSGTTITYQPNAGFAGADSFTFTASNSGGTSAPVTVSITVQDAVITITPSGGFVAAVAAPYTQTFTFNGGAQPWSGYQVTNLPAGLSITGTTANTVTIAGTPTQAGTFNLNASATDTSTGNGPYTVGQAFALTVAGPGLSLSPAAGSFNAPYGQAFSQAFTATGGTGPYTYALTGTLPAGLSFAGGTLSGTPTAPGAYPITVTATDTGSTGTGAPFTVAQNYTINVSAPTITLAPASLSNPVAGAAYSQTVTASGGVGPYGYAITAGSLPTGLTLSSGGALTGTATAVGTFNFTVTGTDNFGQTGSRAYTVTVAAPVLTMAPAPGTLNAPYAQSFSQAFTAAGGSGSFSYALTGTLPAGLSFSGGTISGTPTVPGSYPITVTATDTVLTGAGAPFSIAQNYTIDVAAPTITVGPASLPNPVLGIAYNQNLSASGGAISYAFAITAGSLPSGISLSGGTLAGTTFEVGTFNFTVTATDGNGQTGSQSYTLTIAPPVLTMTPAAGPLTAPYAQAYSQAFTASGGSGTFAYSLTGALPAGLSFSNGTISGTPTVPGSYPITVTATDQTVTGVGAPFSVAQNYTLNVPAPTIVVSPATLPGASVGTAFSQALSATGGAGTTTFSVTGSLPAGVTLSGATLAGTPTEAGTFNLTMTATDANGQTGTRAYTLNVAAPALALSPASGALAITYAAPFNRSFAASGGVGPYSYALTGTLPAGLSFNAATATVAGTPTTSGNFSFAITATDTGSTGLGAPFSVTGNYTLAIAAPTITVTPASLPGGTAGQAYSVSLAGAGAVAPYSFSLTSGTLPAGVTLSATGQLAGTPTASGTFPITVLVRDANGQQASVNLSLTIAVPTLTVTPASLPGALFGIAYNQQLTVSGGLAPYSFAVSSGALPAGLTLAATTGLISGTPSAAGAFPFAVTVRDSTGGTAATVTVNYTLQVQQRPDPAQDPEVRGLVQAQAEAAKRFATTQINNFQQRLERLHEGGSGDGDDGNRISVTNSVRISTPDVCRDALVMANSARCVQQRNALSQLSGLGGYNEAAVSGAGVGSGVAGIAGTGAGSGDATAPATGDARAASGGNGSATGSWGIWTAGLIRFGDQEAGAGRASYEFESEGVTIGADYRFSPNFAAGVGVGFGRDTADIGSNGSRSRGEAQTVAAYASFLPGGKVFIDGLIGYQWLDFDLRRYVTSTGSLVDSKRSGHQRFGSVSLGADLAKGNWQITPYARIDLSRARLNGYAESTGSVFDLTFLDQNVDSTTLGLGTRVRYTHDLGWGRLYPELRGEYQWQLDRNGDVLVTYADRLAGPYSAIRLAALDRDELTLGGKLDLELNSGWLFGLEYTGRFASGAGSDSTVKVVISHEF